MPALADFLSVVPVQQEMTDTKKNFEEGLEEYRHVVEDVLPEFGVYAYHYTEEGKTLLRIEEMMFRECLMRTGSMPGQFATSCLGTKESYNYLSDYYWYPEVKVGALKSLADAMELVILPIDYINMDKLFRMYFNRNFLYATKIADCYKDFEKTLKKCEDYLGKQQIYIMAPLSFYDPWEEVSADKPLPKYFAQSLSHLSVTLGLIIPTQRNLFKMIETNRKNINSLEKTMTENFESLRKSIEECNRRIGWVQQMEQVHIRKLQKKVSDLEHKLYCLLDPLIFSVKADVDISNYAHDNRDARIGLCFGMDMPIDFFVERNLKQISDSRMQEITHVLKLEEDS